MAYGTHIPKQERIIAREEITVERKKFKFELAENDRGRLVRITEDVNGRYDRIVLPEPGLGDFLKALTKLAAISDRT